MWFPARRAAVAPVVLPLALLSLLGAMTTPAAGTPVGEPVGLADAGVVDDGRSTGAPMAPADRRPRARDDGYTVLEDRVLRTSRQGVLVNDRDPEGARLRARLVRGPRTGTARVTRAGRLVVRPASDHNGVLRVRYAALDPAGRRDAATARVRVVPVNDAPSFVLGPDLSVAEDSGAQRVPLWATAVSPGPADERRQSLGFEVLADTPGLFSQQPSVAPDGTLAFAAASDAAGSSIVRVRVRDDGGTDHRGVATSAWQTFRITVGGSNDVPVVSLDAPAAIDEGDTMTLTATGSDPDGDPLTYAFDCEGDGTYEQPSSATTATCSPVDDSVLTVRVLVDDGRGGQATATRTVTVDNVAPAVLAAPAQSAVEGVPTTLALGSFTDPGDDGPWQVTVDWGDGSDDTRYPVDEPGALEQVHLYGDDTPPDTYDVTVTVTEAGGAASGSAVTVVGVDAVNDAPIAPDLSLATPVDVPVTGNVLAGASDPEGDSLSAAVAAAPAHGTVVLNPATGAFTYTPGSGYEGGDSFEVVVSDGNGATTTVRVQVAVGNRAPVAVDDDFETAEDVPVSIGLDDLTANDSDPDGDAIAVNVASSAINGSLGFVGGRLVFTPHPEFSGQASFRYGITDGRGRIAQATARITVRPVDDPAILVADVGELDEDGEGSGDVLANDSDVDTELAVTGFSADGEDHPAGGSHVFAGKGTLTLAADGSWTFRPERDWNGALPQVAYTVTGGSTSTLGVTVRPVNDVPVAQDDLVTTERDTPVAIALTELLANDSDVDGDVLVLFSASSAVHGTLGFVGGRLTFTPDSGFVGQASFAYGVHDGHGGVATGTVRIEVTAPPP